MRNSYIDERTEKKIQEHLTNEHDIITEQDIANAPTGIVEGKEPIEPGNLPKDKRKELEEADSVLEETKVKDNADPAIETSWNVLGS